MQGKIVFVLNSDFVTAVKDSSLTLQGNTRMYKHTHTIHGYYYEIKCMINVGNVMPILDILLNCLKFLLLLLFGQMIYIDCKLIMLIYIVSDTDIYIVIEIIMMYK